MIRIHQTGVSVKVLDLFFILYTKRFVKARSWSDLIAARRVLHKTPKEGRHSPITSIFLHWLIGLVKETVYEAQRFSDRSSKIIVAEGGHGKYTELALQRHQNKRAGLKAALSGLLRLLG